MIFLQFAEVCIGLVFLPTGEPDIYEKPLINKIVISFGGYMVKKRKVDHTISFEKKEEYEYLFNSKKNKEYILISQKISNKQSKSFYHISMSQLQILFRNICQKVIAGKGGIIIHSSSSAKNGMGYIFLGDSGAGKSTIVRGLSDKLAPFSDDSTILRKLNKSWFMFQSPILQKNKKIIQTSLGMQIAGVFFIRFYFY